MNRALIITVGIVVILLVVGLWVFLLLYGAPERPLEIFSDLGITEDTQRDDASAIDENANSQTQTALVSIQDTVFQQLTTEPIAGFGFVTDEDTQSVYYAEKGTGHLYAIDLGTGIKTQLSLTTTQNTNEVLFSSNGFAVVMLTDTIAFAAFIPDNPEVSLEKILLPSGIKNVTFIDEDTINYTKNTRGQTTAYTFDMVSQAEEQLFAVQIPDVVINWGAGKSQTLLYPKPTQFLPSSLYEMRSDALYSLTDNKYGLVPFAYGETIIISALNQDTYISTELTSNGAGPTLGTFVLPEKCVAQENASVVWCASPANQLGSSYLEDWYKGNIISDDWLWEVDIPTGNARLVSNLKEVAGRSIDVDMLHINTEGTKLLLRNKTDNTLWLYPLQ